MRGIFYIDQWRIFSFSTRVRIILMIVTHLSFSKRWAFSGFSSLFFHLSFIFPSFLISRAC
ncbi:hypothetical protein V8C40DRAFT_176681 [Trichoderma camerunense]